MILSSVCSSIGTNLACGFKPIKCKSETLPSKRIEAAHLPKEETKRHAYAQTGGADGCHLWDALEAPEAPAEVRALPLLETLRRTWQRHDERSPAPGTAQGPPRGSRVRCTSNRERPRAAEGIESPDDTDARSRNQRDTQGTG
jgi:hypothetical protein